MLYVTYLYNEVDECQIHSNCNAKEEIEHSRLHTEIDSNTLTVTPSQCSDSTGTKSGFHSLGYKKFQDFSRTPEAFFQDTVVSQQCLNIETNSSY